VSGLRHYVLEIDLKRGLDMGIMFRKLAIGVSVLCGKSKSISRGLTGAIFIGSAILATSHVCHATTLLVDSSGNAIGLTGLAVDGQTYNVQFAFQSFNQAYSSSTPIFFGNPPVAADANTALLGALNSFNVTTFSDLSAAGGSTFEVNIAFNNATAPGYYYGYEDVFNYYGPGWAYGGANQILAGADYGHNEQAIFSLAPVSATPLPAALPLFASGLAAAGLIGWRRKRRPLL
jgi:hypothetical protein